MILFKLNPWICCSYGGNAPDGAMGNDGPGMSNDGRNGGSSSGSDGRENNGANRVSSGDPTSKNGYGGTPQGVLDTQAANNPGFSSDKDSMNDVNHLKAMGYGLFNGVKGYVVGKIPGAVKGLVDGYKESVVDQVAENMVEAGMPAENAKAAAKDFCDAIARESQRESSSPDVGGREDTIISNAMASVGLTVDQSGALTRTLSSNLKNKASGGSDVTTGTDYQYDMSNRQAMTDLFNSYYDNAFAEYQAKADKINSAVENRNTTLGNLISDTQSGMSDYKDSLTAGESKQANILDGIRTKLEESNNLEPITFTAGGNTFSYVPRPNRDTAKLIADLGQQGFDNTKTASQGIWDTTQSGNESLNDYSNSQMINDLLSAETNPTLEYIDALKDLVKTENSAIANDNGLAVDQQQVDNSKPGTLDKILGYMTLAKGASSIFDW